MKRVKMMLTTIGVLTVVGGAVAFKAAKFGGVTYCIGVPGSGFCPTKVTNKSFMVGIDVCYRQIPANGICSTSIPCTACGDLIN